MRAVSLIVRVIRDGFRAQFIRDRVAQSVTFDMFLDEQWVDFHIIIFDSLKKQFQVNAIIAGSFKSNPSIAFPAKLQFFLKPPEPLGVVGKRETIVKHFAEVADDITVVFVL